MDTLPISSAKATTVQQPIVPTAPAASDPSAESANIAGRTQASPESTEAAKLEAPGRDSRSLQYLVDGNRVITTIVDDNSKKVVVQIPDAELIRIAKSIDRMQGFFIEQQA